MSSKLHFRQKISNHLKEELANADSNEAKQQLNTIIESCIPKQQRHYFKDSDLIKNGVTPMLFNPDHGMYGQIKRTDQGQGNGYPRIGFGIIQELYQKQQPLKKHLHEKRGFNDQPYQSIQQSLAPITINQTNQSKIGQDLILDQNQVKGCQNLIINEGKDESNFVASQQNDIELEDQTNNLSLIKIQEGNLFNLPDQYIYQEAIFNRTIQKYDQGEQGCLLYLETGSGKSYLAIKIIKYLYGINPEIKELTEEELHNKQPPLKKLKVIFLVNTQNLEEQQCSVLNRYTPFRVVRYGTGTNYKRLQKHSWFRQDFDKNDIFVFVAKKFQELLLHGYLRIQETDLIVFDEAHHAQQEHIYNLILTDYFYPALIQAQKDVSATPGGPLRMPKILALTASPIKKKLTFINDTQELEQNLIELVNNLYCTIIPVTAEEINQIRKENNIVIISYKCDLANIIREIQNIYLDIIKPTLRMTDLPENIVKMDDQVQIQKELQNLFDSDLNASFSQYNWDSKQVTQLKFNQQQKIIDLNHEFLRDISQTISPNKSERLISLLAIIVIKNVNSLTVELGLSAVYLFLINIFKQIARTNSLGYSKERLLSILQENLANRLSFSQDFNFSSDSFEQQLLLGKTNNLSKFIVSGKVIGLLEQLSSEYLRLQDLNKELKAIVFVSDRTVAYYLSIILNRIAAFFLQNYQVESVDQSLNASLNKYMHEIQLPDEQEDSNIFDQAKKPFRVAFAIGPQGKSLISKAKKSACFKESLNEKTESEIESSFGSDANIRLSSNQLIDTLKKFNSGIYNVLISTSVIEEGLDIKTCNLVINLNETITIKSFIQTKGRAREKDSKYIFLCSEERKAQFDAEFQEIKYQIDCIEHIAFHSGKEVKPEPGYVKKADESLYIETIFGARCHARDTPILLDALVRKINEIKLSGQLDNEKFKQLGNKKDQNPQYDPYFSERKEGFNTISKTLIRNNQRQFYSIVVFPQILKHIETHIEDDIYTSYHRSTEKYKEIKAKFLQDKDFQYVLDELDKLDEFQDAKQFFENQNRNQEDEIRSFSSKDKRNLPIQHKKLCGRSGKGNEVTFIDEIKGSQIIEAYFEQKQVKRTFPKKKDSENYACLLAVHRLKNLGLFDDYLNPNVDLISVAKEQPQENIDKTERIDESQKQDIKEQMKSEKEDLEMSQAAFNIEKKKSKSKIQTEDEKDNFNKDLGKLSDYLNEDKLDKLYVMVFICEDMTTGVRSSYPFRNTKQFLGILYDKDITSMNLKLLLSQDTKQQMKNEAFIYLLHKYGLISQQTSEEMKQSANYLSIRVKCIPIQQLLPKYDELEIIDVLHKIKNYHTFSICMVYCAQYFFYVKLLRRKYTFGYLFQSILELIDNRKRPEYSEYVRKIFGEGLIQYANKFKAGKNLKFDEMPNDLRLGTFILPVKETSSGFQIDLELLDNVITFIKDELLGLFKYLVSFNTIKALYDLIEGQRLQEKGLNVMETLMVRNLNFIQQAKQNLCLQNIISVFNPSKAYELLSDKYSDDLLHHRVYEKKEGEVLEQNREDEAMVYMRQDQVRSRFGQEGVEQSSMIAKQVVRSRLDEINEGIYPIKTEKFRSILALIDNLDFWNIDRSISFYNQKNKLHYESQRQFQQRDGEHLTVRDHFFLKNGVYIHKNESQWNFKLAKQKHMQDVRKLHADDDDRSNTSTKYNTHIIPELNDYIWTRFDLPSQLIKVTPWNYEKFQVLLTASSTQVQLGDTFKILKLLDHELIINLQLPQEESEKRGEISLNQVEVKIDEELKKSNNVSQWFRDNPLLVKEALTAPTVDQNLNYERLEFYGDSVISFLVVLELFLCENQNLSEGDMDILRIKRISNMNFQKINRDSKLYKYMIIEQNQVYSDNIPAGFESWDFLDNIRQKHQNEIMSKAIYLNQLEQYYKEWVLQEKQGRNIYDQHVTEEHVTLLKQFLTYPELRKSLKYHLTVDKSQSLYSKAIFILRDLQQQKRAYYKFQEQTNFTSKSILFLDNYYELAYRLMLEEGVTFNYLILMVIVMNSQKTFTKHNNEKTRKGVKHRIVLKFLDYKFNPQNGDNMSTSSNTSNPSVDVRPSSSLQPEKKQVQISLKQLADEVESIVGMIARNCGLEVAQQILKHLTILKHNKSEMDERLEHFYKSMGLKPENMKNVYCQNLSDEEKENLIQSLAKQGLKNVTRSYIDKLGGIEENALGYIFKQKELLIKALTHKSAISQNQSSVSSTVHKDYERMEFLGDSIINFTIAQRFFLKSEDKKSHYKPKELHRQKTAIIKNALLSLVIIENKIDEVIQIDTSQQNFKEQFDNYIRVVKTQQELGLINESKKTTKEVAKAKLAVKEKFEKWYNESQEKIKLEDPKTKPEERALLEKQVQKKEDELQKEWQNLLVDFEEFYMYNLKVFGDVFESVIAAVFLDSKDLEKTQQVIYKLLDDYITVYGDLKYITDHPRTVLLELINSKDYSKMLKCVHHTEVIKDDKETNAANQKIKFTAFLETTDKKKLSLMAMKFTQNTKNKVRKFYNSLKHFFDFANYGYEKKYPQVYLRDSRNYMDFIRDTKPEFNLMIQKIQEQEKGQPPEGPDGSGTDKVALIYDEHMKKKEGKHLQDPNLVQSNMSGQPYQPTVFKPNPILTKEYVPSQYQSEQSIQKLNTELPSSLKLFDSQKIQSNPNQFQGSGLNTQAEAFVPKKKLQQDKIEGEKMMREQF